MFLMACRYCKRPGGSGTRSPTRHTHAQKREHDSCAKGDRHEHVTSDQEFHLRFPFGAPCRPGSGHKPDGDCTHRVKCREKRPQFARVVRPQCQPGGMRSVDFVTAGPGPRLLSGLMQGRAPTVTTTEPARGPIGKNDAGRPFPSRLNPRSGPMRVVSASCGLGP